MSKLELKAAMDSLQVKTPLKLQVKAPTFRAPAVPAGDSWVQNQSQDVDTSKDTDISQVPSVSLDQNESLDARTSPVHNPSQDVDQSLVENKPKDLVESQDTIKSQDLTPSPDVATPQDGNSTQVVFRSSQPRKATEQDRAVTEATSLKSRLSTGYTRIPNALLMTMVAGNLSRNEIKLLLLIARMTISFNRPMASLSKGVLGRMTGIQGRAVLEALQSIETKGHIKKVTGDHNSPNRLGLVEYDSIEQVSKQQPARKGTQGEIRTPDVLSTQRWGENSPYKKDNLETKKENLSFSSQFQSEYLKNYFSEMKPKRKRETEFQAFKDLRSDFQEAEISMALEYLLKHGMPGSGEPCHSPMAYLAKAIGQILDAAKGSQEKQQKRLEREAAALQEKATREAEEEREKQDTEIREQAFTRTYPSEEEQAEAISQFGRRFPMLSQNGPLLRNLAISAWWDEQNPRKLTASCD